MIRNPAFPEWKERKTKDLFNAVGGFMPLGFLCCVQLDPLLFLSYLDAISKGIAIADDCGTVDVACLSSAFRP